MEKQEVIITSSIAVGETVITLMSKLKTVHRYGKQGILATGNIQPESVIINAPSFRKTFLISGEEVSPDRLPQELPDIAEVPDTTQP
jgi:hypothetical protein